MKKYFIETKLSNGFVVTNGRPHIREIAHVQSAHDGGLTAQYYFLCRYLGYDIAGEEVLLAIASLQDTDIRSETFGCCRWFSEESKIFDTNGAFFVLKPLMAAMRFCKDKIPAREQELIYSMLYNARKWFLKECKSYGLYYPNKIVNDGALLSLIGYITEDAQTIEEAEKFWHSWLEYTKKYGWGWGENTSANYASITIEGLDLALSAYPENSELFKELCEVRNSLIDYAMFHNEYEYVPSIRSYNFAGKCKNTLPIGLYPQSVKNLEGLKKETLYGRMSAYIIHHKLSMPYTPEPSDDKTRVEHIFGKSSAVTYKGDNIRLGTVSHFPVMPGCYENDGWGLAWQSMPVSALAINHGLSYLRYTCKCEENMYSHPIDAACHNSGARRTSLFNDKNIPEVDILCEQKENVAVIVKQMKNIANKVSYLADEWFVPSFLGKIEKNGDWFVINYGDCALAVKAINGVIECTKDGESIRLSQCVYDGEELMLVKRRWITCWAVVAIDDVCDLKDKLDKIKTDYIVKPDLRISRETHPFVVSCGDAKLYYDPDTAFNFTLLETN